MQQKLSARLGSIADLNISNNNNHHYRNEIKNESFSFSPWIFNSSSSLSSDHNNIMRSVADARVYVYTCAHAHSNHELFLYLADWSKPEHRSNSMLTEQRARNIY